MVADRIENGKKKKRKKKHGIASRKEGFGSCFFFLVHFFN
jgi:hypothetical protein